MLNSNKIIKSKHETMKEQRKADAGFDKIPKTMEK